MPSSLRKSTAVVLASFSAAALAGWFTAPAPPSSTPSSLLDTLTNNTPAFPTAAPSPGAAVSVLEQTLTEILHPSPDGRFSGAKLTELCAEDLRRGRSLSRGMPYGRAWAGKAPAEMFAWFQKQKGFYQSRFVTVLFESWAATDPIAATKAALQCADKSHRAAAVSSIIRLLHRIAPASAADLAATHLSLYASERLCPLSPDGPDFQKDWGFLRALPPGKDRGIVLTQYFDKLLHRETRAAVQIWKDLPEDVRLEMIAGGFCGGYPDQSGFPPPVPDGMTDTQRLYLERTGDPEVLKQFLASGGQVWAARDPAAAVAWANEHLHGVPRTNAVLKMLESGAGGNFDAALLAWQTLPDGILRAQAAGFLAAGASTEHDAEIEAMMESLPARQRAIADEVRLTPELSSIHDALDP